MGKAHIEDKIICMVHTRERGNFIFSVAHDMQMVRKLHCRSAVLKCFGFRTPYIANFLKLLLLLGGVIIDKLANYDKICCYRVHEIRMVFYIFKGLLKKKKICNKEWT